MFCVGLRVLNVDFVFSIFALFWNAFCDIKCSYLSPTRLGCVIFRPLKINEPSHEIMVLST